MDWGSFAWGVLAGVVLAVVGVMIFNGGDGDSDW